jgi:ergothioneine biosynthesis protein EgtB
MAALLAKPLAPDVSDLVVLGLQHEQQHQELILTDLLHLLSCNPLAPVYRAGPDAPPPLADGGLAWVAQPGGLVTIGATDAQDAGFAFDNERPRHQVWLAPHALASRPVSQGDWAAFIADGGYGDARWWMSAGWDWVRSQGIAAPAYWRRDGADWQRFTLQGLQPLQAGAPVAHVSWFEADAYARWHAAQHHAAPPSRLPTEAEWEAAAQPLADAALAAGNFLESGALQPQEPQPAAGGPALQQLLGDVWDWTASPYTAYPGFRPWDGAVGEYNGKFMVNQMVLRGGSCATPRSHIRTSYRNFFPTDTRWQFSGLRLARDAG